MEIKDSSKPFTFSGARTIEELEAKDVEKNAPPPKEEEKTEPVVEEKTPPPPKEEKKVDAPKSTWLEEANKHFKTDFKSPEDFSKVFEKAKKADEYEPKVKGFEEVENKYKEQLNELQRSLNPLEYFPSPQSYIAEQLRKQHPDKSPYVLQEVVTADNRLMDDVDVLVKNQLLETPDLIGGEAGAKEYVLDKYGIDPATPKEEWSTTLRNKIKIEANQARKQWDELKKQVQLPKVMSPEERQAENAKAMAERTAKLEPIKQTFTKFDKFTEEIEDGKVFDFIVPDEYKSELPQLFDATFVAQGMQPTEENLAAMEEIKHALLLKRNFKQIYKVIEGDVQARERAERDKLLNNTTPPNTQTATEAKTDSQKFGEEHGLGKLFRKK